MINEIEEFFEGVEDHILSDFNESFYAVKIPTYDETSDLINKFLESTGLSTAYANHIIDKNEPKSFFSASSSSEKEVLSNVQIAILMVISFRFNKGSVINKDRENKIDFLTMKEKLLDICWHLNNNEIYIYSKEEDFKLTNKVESMKWRK